MREIQIADEDAHAQPKSGSRRSSRHDEANAPRDAEKECVICQEEKQGSMSLTPCCYKAQVVFIMSVSLFSYVDFTD